MVLNTDFTPWHEVVEDVRSSQAVCLHRQCTTALAVHNFEIRAAQLQLLAVCQPYAYPGTWVLWYVNDNALAIF